MEKWGFGLSRTEVLDTVQNFVKQNKIVTNCIASRPGEDSFLGV